ncbi:MAG: ComF family protein [Gammaproteobacteria bacterium]|nr:ComF family protein [Gammaproteobacteria bacterium]
MLTRIINTIYPPSCVLCGGHGRPSRDLCEGCESDFIVNLQACGRCALPLPFDLEAAICGECLRSPPQQHRAWSAFVYAQPLEWMIQQLKFNDKMAFGQLLGQLAVACLPELDATPDCIIPVPLHPKRQQQRGYNQAYELVKPLARHLNIAIDTTSCLRQKYTSAQSDLDARQRRKNIRNAFQFDNSHQYGHVIVFDDVITTGSTIAELVKAIKQQGVSRVDVWSLARVGK